MDDRTVQLDFNFAQDDLLEFPRDLGEEGWFQFHSEQKLAIQALEKRFGISLNKKVRIRLDGMDETMEGRLVLDSLLLPSPTEESIRLRLGRFVFENTAIAHYERVE